MANLEDGRIYEFIENKYSELRNRDGGYYATKHDQEVFKEASIKFNMSIGELGKIYNRFQDISTRKQIDKLNKLPKALRDKKRLEMMGDILKNNRDLAFYELEGDPVNPIKSGLTIINEEYRELAKKIGENGWTLPMIMGLSKFEKLFAASNSGEDVSIYDNFFNEFYNSKNLKLMIKHINNSPIIDIRKQLFNDCVEAYENKKYLLCINSLVPILEGILSEFDDDKTNIRMMKVCKKNVDDTERENKLIVNLAWISFYSFISILYKQSKFDDNEPTLVNRHWILHGRTEREYGKEDCLRLFNAIYTIVAILKYK